MIQRESWTRLALDSYVGLWTAERCYMNIGVGPIADDWLFDFNDAVWKWLNEYGREGWLYYINCDYGVGYTYSKLWPEIAFRDPRVATMFKLTWS